MCHNDGIMVRLRRIVPESLYVALQSFYVYAVQLHGHPPSLTLRKQWCYSTVLLD
ncbi:hypothetical protein BH18ACT15_BH18ACT15_12370 [soil metagenome]